jgi:hypothetical protein
MSEKIICPFCGKRDAGLLCDGVLAAPSLPGAQARDPARGNHTCDRPVCVDCRTNFMVIHISRRGPGYVYGETGVGVDLGKREWDTRDRCPTCQQLHAMGLLDHYAKVPIDDSWIADLRARRWAVPAESPASALKAIGWKAGAK